MRARALLLAAALGGAAACGHRPVAPALRELSTTDLPPPPRGCLVANHVHTIVSDRYSHAPTAANTPWAYSPAGLRAAIDAFRRVGVDAIVITDHNATHAHFDPAAREAGMTVLMGMEWTTRRGHALLIGFRAASPDDAPPVPPWRARISAADFRAMVDATHARGGLVVIAHPRVPFRTWPEDTFGADGVEVWGLDEGFMRNRDAVRWWHGRLARGERLLALAGTDLHPGARIRSHHYPLNRVDAPRCDRDSLLAAMRAGHVLLVRSADAPRVALAVPAGGAPGRVEAVAGDALALAGREVVALQLRVVGGAGTRLTVHGRDGLVLVRDLTDADVALQIELRVRPGDFVRAEVHRARTLLALTNPIYFRE